MKHNICKYQRGNALFLILIAVALFAALSYAVTQSGRGGGSIERETRLLTAASVSQHIAEIQNAVQRMQIISNCTANDISFEHSDWGHANYDHTPAAREECQIYHPNGGGATFQTIDTSVLHSSKSALATFGQYAFSGGVWIYQADDTTVDLTMMVPHLTEDFCMELQTEMGETGAFQTNGANWLGSLDAANMAFDGDYANQYSFSSTRHYSCIQLAGSTDNYLFYYTLIDH